MSNDASLLKTDLVTDFQQPSQPKSNQNVLSKKLVGVLIALVIMSVLVFVIAIALNKNDGGVSKVVPPVRLTLALPKESPFPIVMGESRVVEVLLFSGHDDRMGKDFQQVTEREVAWSVSPVGIVQVDAYGRIETLKEGDVTIKVHSKKNASVFEERLIRVVKKQEKDTPLPTRVVNYIGKQGRINPVQQKVVTFMSLDQATASDVVPQAIKDVILDSQAQKTTYIQQQNGAKWTSTPYADKSGRNYIVRENINEENPLDWIMHLMGNRYIPGDGTEVLSIADDAHNGIWLVNKQGVSHIAMEAISYRKKAEMLLQQTKEKVMRHGLASSGQLKDGKWVGVVTDNDGLWTSMYTAGQFFRYNSLKLHDCPPEEIAKARASAIYSLKAMLLTANIPMRDTTVQAKLRHYTNTRAGSGQKLSKEFLKQGKPFSVDTYAGSAADGEGFFGVDAGKIVDGASYGGSTKYTFQPTKKGDWTQNRQDPAATSKRTLKGFMARTYVMEAEDGPAPDGLFFRHREDGKQEVISGADKLYDYTKDQHPILDLGNADLPQILKDFVTAQQKGEYNRSDLIYKGDTSTDQVIGHLFVYKIAFDRLDQADPQELALRELIKSTMVNFCTCLTNNDYTMVDATGQGTSWAKLTHTFLTSDFTLEDAPLKALQLLLSFKLCHYLTGDSRWQNEYTFLIEDPSFRYLELVAAVWQRWSYRTFNEDSSPQSGMYHLDPSVEYSEDEIERHIIACLHFSDEEEAFLGYYLAFQLEDDPKLLQLYRKGIDGWWHSISRSENPLWYYIYQLAYPSDPPIKDHYGNQLVQTASWQLSRHPVDTTETVAFIEGARDDVIVEGKEKLSSLSMDPTRIIGRRKQKSDAEYFSREINYKVVQDYDPMNIYEFKVLPADERRLHKFNGATFQNVMGGNARSIQACTLYTLPYWLGVNHGFLPMEKE